MILGDKMHRKLTVLLFALLPVLAAGQSDVDTRYDPDRALTYSQASIGRPIRDHLFTDSMNRAVSLHDFAGKPLLISMIFTSCHHVCPMTTKHLDRAVANAREALGGDSFEVLTIGFDAARDTPDALRTFARAQGINTAGWHFLSANSQTIEALAADLGFIYFPTPRGFDHINQVTIVDRQSRVYNQVYGVSFELPALVEPLKQLVFNRPESAGKVLAGFIDRVRLFCTVYDPASGRYKIDNSLFFQVAIGFIVLLSVMLYLWRGFRPSDKT